MSEPFGFFSPYGQTDQLQTNFHAASQALSSMSLPELIEEADAELKDIAILQHNMHSTMTSTTNIHQSFKVPPPLIPADIELFRYSILDVLDTYVKSQQAHIGDSFKHPLQCYYDQYMTKLNNAYQQDSALEQFREGHAPPHRPLQESNVLAQPTPQTVAVPDNYRCPVCHIIMTERFKPFKVKGTNPPVHYCESCKDVIVNTFDPKTFTPVPAEMFVEDVTLRQTIDGL